MQRPDRQSRPVDLPGQGARVGQSDFARQDAGRRTARRRHQPRDVGGRRRRLVVQDHRQRPHRSAAGEKTLRAGRDGQLPGAHAVPRSDRADHGRTRRHHRHLRAPAVRQRAGVHDPGQECLRAQRLRLRAGGARARRQRAADGAGRSRQAGLQARYRAAARRLGRQRIEGAGHGRQAGLQNPRQGQRVGEGHASRRPAGAEVALAAVDVGLLELMPNTSWDLLEAMMQQRSLQVQTATAQMQVVGKRHFGRKAVPHGGGGGKSASRELFDTLLFWKARVTLDANGEASVQVPINDSLTAFRIVAIASANADLFGTGKTEVHTSQDLMLLSGLPALVREGDKFHAGYTLRNASSGAPKIELDASVAGKALAPQLLSLDAGQAREVGWDYQVPFGVADLQWDVSAKVSGSDDPASSDKLRVHQKVVAAVPVQTLQATLLQLDHPQSMSVRIPSDAIAGRGGVQALFSARLGVDLPGVGEYMSRYPYTCFEQSTSRAIALRDPARWKALVATLPAHLDGDGLVKYWPIMEQGSDTLTAYVLSATAEAGYAISPELKGRMEEGLLGFVRGKVMRDSSLKTADLAVRKIAALEALSRSGRVTADELQSFEIAPNLWPTSAVIDWYLILHRQPALPERDQRLAQAQQILRARLNLQGTTMTFSTERTDNWWWLMTSADSNANRLMLAMLGNPA